MPVTRNWNDEDTTLYFLSLKADSSSYLQSAGDKADNLFQKKKLWLIFGNILQPVNLIVPTVKWDIRTHVAFLTQLKPSTHASIKTIMSS